MSEISIKVTIANRSYPLSVKPEEEIEIKKAVELIDTHLKDLEKSYAVRDKQDLLAMIALQLASKLIDSSSKEFNTDEVMRALSLVEEKLNTI